MASTVIETTFDIGVGSCLARSAMFQLSPQHTYVISNIRGKDQKELDTQWLNSAYRRPSRPSSYIDWE